MMLYKVPAGIYISPAKAAPVALPGSIRTSDPSLAVQGPWACVYVGVRSVPFPRDKPIVPCQMAAGDSFPPQAI